MPKTTYELVCHETRQTVWVGCGDPSQGMDTFYPEDSSHAMGALVEFLKLTAGKPIVLMNTSETPADYETIEVTPEEAHRQANLERPFEPAEKEPGAALALGDVVASIHPAWPLRSGGQVYSHAVVVQCKPLVLVSEHADMRWESTVRADKLRVIGKASSHLLAHCLKRL